MAQSNHGAKRVKPGGNAGERNLDIQVDKDGLRWTLRAGLEELPGQLSIALSGPDHPGPDLKTSRLRRVRKVIVAPPCGFADHPDGAREVVVKEHTPHGPAAILRSWFVGSPAAREWRIVCFLHSRGVAVPEPLGFGRRVAGRRGGIVVLQAIAGAVTLEDILMGRAAIGVSRRILARRTGRLVRAMHDAGVRHPDLHAANLLVSPEGTLTLIDFHSARIASKPLSFHDRMRDLIPFAGAFLVCARSIDRLRFFKAYCDGLGSLESFEIAVKNLESAAWSRLRKFLKKYDLRPLRRGKAFAPLHIHGRRGMGVRNRRASDLARSLGTDPVEMLGRVGFPIKVDQDSSVYSLPYDGERFVVKVYHRPGVTNWLKRLVGRCRARAAWVAGHRLRARLLPAPQPLLYLTDRAVSFRGRSLVVFEEATGIPTLDRFAQSAAHVEKRRTLCALARGVARMHNFFLTNRDLKAQNILVDREGAPVFVDPDGVAEAAEITIGLMARDLMRLNASFLPGGSFSATDRLRFLKSYARARRLSRSTVDVLRAAITTRTLAKWARWRRAGKN